METGSSLKSGEHSYRFDGSYTGNYSAGTDCIHKGLLVDILWADKQRSVSHTAPRVNCIQTFFCPPNGVVLLFALCFRLRSEIGGGKCGFSAPP